MRWYVLFPLSLLSSSLLWAANAREPLKCPDVASRHLTVAKGEYEPPPGVTLHLEDFVADIVPQSKQLPYCLQNDTHVPHRPVFLASAALTRTFTHTI